MVQAQASTLPLPLQLQLQLASKNSAPQVSSLRFDVFGGSKARVAPTDPLPTEDGVDITYKNVGLVFAASLWDAQRRMLNALLGAPRVDATMELVVLTDLAVRAVVVVYFTLRTYQFFLGASTAIELSLFGQLYAGMAIVSLVVYSAERLAGRCVPSATVVEKDWVPWEICGREPMTAPKAVVVTFVYALISASVVVAVLSAASTLERTYDRSALDVLVLLLVSELLYVQSRLKTFDEIAEQSSTAAKIAGFHTLYTLCFMAPMTVSYIVYVSSL